MAKNLIIILGCFISILIINESVQAQKNQKLFTLLNSKITHIEFANTIKDTKEHNIYIYDNFYGGAGVGTGDFNNDGLIDLYFTGNLVGDKMYLNMGNMTFKDITASAGIIDDGSWSSGVTLADINNDGFIDIYVSKELYDEKPFLRANKLYINNGDVTFTESAAAYNLNDTTRTRQATFLDYDKDGDLDLFLLNQPPNPGSYSKYAGMNLLQARYSPKLMANNGNGTFTDVTKKAGVLKAGYANSASSGDFNNDGWADIYVANDFEAPDFFYLNNGDGTFKNIIDESAKHISYYSMGVDAADIDNNGTLDIMTLDMVAEDNFRIKANMGGMNPEVFWDIVESGGHRQYMFNALQLNHGQSSNGNPILSEIGQLSGVSSTDWSWSNLFADFDNDGFKDLYVTNGLLRDIRNRDSGKQFGIYINEIAQKAIRENPDKLLNIWDIIDLDKAVNFMPSVKLKNYAFKNNGDLTFSKKMDDWGLDQKTFSNGAAYADLDNDGDLDLIVNNINEKAFVYRNNASQQLKNNFLRIRLSSNKKLTSQFGARATIKYRGKIQTQELTDIRGIYSASEPIFHFGLGPKIDMIDELVIKWSNDQETTMKAIKANQILTIDKNESRHTNKTQKVEENYIFEEITNVAYVNYKHIENDFDDFKKQELLPHKMSNFGSGLAVGDVNNDGLEDFFVGGASGQSGQLFLQKKGSEFQESNSAPWELDQKSEDMGSVFFDSDGDGDQDLYVVSGGNEFISASEHYTDRLYINDGNGNFKKSIELLPKNTISGSRVVTADYDNDGDLDLFIGGRLDPWNYPSPVSSTILENNGGTFEDVTPMIAKDLQNIGMVTDAIWTDFNLDGKLDLIVVGEWMPVTFLSNENGTFKNITESTGIGNNAGWWFSIEKGDFDEDGDEDLVVGNLGLNYKYKASETEPFDIYYGDFDQNGAKDIVLGYYNFGELYPLRGRSCSSSQIPSITQKFTDYNSFSEANIFDVYGEHNLDNSLQYHARTFSSQYIENLGNGTFKTKSLPNEAQMSSVNDFLVQDFNNDGHLDLILAGNLYSAEIETTRNDAGIGTFLKGNGKGDFESIPYTKTGLLMNKDVKELKVINTPKGRVIIVANNNDILQVIKSVKSSNPKN